MAEAFTVDVKKKRALYMRKWNAGRTPEQKAILATNKRNRFYMLRKLVIEKLGGKCICCGFDKEPALQIDHVEGGGQRERKAMGYNSGYPYTYFLRIMEDPDFLTKYQVLCANCNWIKRRERGEYNTGVGSKPRKHIN